MRYFIRELEKWSYKYVEIDDIDFFLYRVYEVLDNSQVQQFINQDFSKEDIEKHIKELFLEITDFEKMIIEYLYGFNDDRHHTYEETGKEFNLKTFTIYEIEETVFDKIRSSDTFQLSSISKKIRDTEKIIKHKVNLKQKILEELFVFILTNSLEKDTLLFNILKKHNIVIDNIKNNTSLGYNISELALSKDSYDGLIKAGIHYYYQIMNLTEEDLVKIKYSKNVNLNIQEILAKKEKIFDKLQTKINKFILSLDIHRNNYITKCRYIYHMKLFSKTSEYLLEELFPESEKSLYNENVTYFSTDVNHFLLQLGYIDVDEVMEDCEQLDQSLYNTGITEEKNYLRNKYLEYIEAHAKLHEIFHEENEEWSIVDGILYQRIK